MHHYSSTQILMVTRIYSWSVVVMKAHIRQPGNAGYTLMTGTTDLSTHPMLFHYCPVCACAQSHTILTKIRIWTLCWEVASYPVNTLQLRRVIYFAMTGISLLT